MERLKQLMSDGDEGCRKICEQPEECEEKPA